MKQAMKALTILVPFMIVACGGGGGGNSGGSTPSDSTPNSFTFSAQTNVAPTTLTTSNSISVGGIDIASAIGVTGGEFSVDGGAFTATAGTVNNGQSITVRQTSSASFSTTTQAILTIGGVSDQFDVTTIAADTVPDSFTFIDQSDVALDTLLESNSITIGGINSGAAISITGGEYSLNGAAFTSAAGTANVGETIVVRQTSSAAVDITTDLELTVGGVSDIFSLTTFDDTVAPVLNVVFPSATSLSYGDTVTLRGTASDDYSAISSLIVNGVDASSTDGFANWTATVPLVIGANDLVVQISDAKNNSDLNAGSVSVERTDTMLGYPKAVAFDSANNRVLIADKDTDSITAVDLATGIKSILSNGGTSFTGSTKQGFLNPLDVVVDGPRNRALVADSDNNNIIAVDLDTGDKSFPFPLDFPAVGAPVDLALDLVGNLVYTIYPELNLVVSYDLVTGVRTVVSDGFTNGGAATPLVNPQGITVDLANNRLLVVDNGAAITGFGGTIVAVDLTDGTRSIFSDNFLFGNISFDFLFDIVIEGSRALVVNGFTPSQGFGQSIMTVDLATGIRDLLWDNTTPVMAGASFQNIMGIDLDVSGSRVFVADDGPYSDTLISIDITSGARTTIASDQNTFSNIAERYTGPWGMVLDEANDRLLSVGHNFFPGPNPGFAPGPARFGNYVKAIDIVTGDQTSITSSMQNSIPLDIGIDAANNRALIQEAFQSQITAVDLSSGALSFVAATPQSPISANQWGLEVDSTNNQAYFVNEPAAQLVRTDLTTGVSTIVSDNSMHGGVNPFNTPTEIALDIPNNRVYVSDQVTGEIFLVSLADGSRTIVSTTGDPSTEFQVTWDMVLDAPNNRMIVSDPALDMIIAFDLTTLARTVISSGIMPNTHNAFSFATSVVLDPSEPTRAWVSERGQNAIMLLDLVTGERVYFSR